QVELHAVARIEGVAGHRVPAGVAGDPPGVGHVAVLPAGMGRTAADGQAGGEAVGGPQVGAVPGHVGEDIAVVRRGHVDPARAAAAGHGAHIAALHQFRVEPGVSAIHGPVVGQAAVEAQLHAVDLLPAGVAGAAVLHGD